jgi:uncharacterized protein
MLLQFDWEQWNIQKNEEKHGVSRLEAESIFFDKDFVVYEDIKHSTEKEKRLISYGLSIQNRVMMCAFTIRNKKIRIISCRTASKKERAVYEKQKTGRN